MHQRLYAALGWTDQDIVSAALPFYALMSLAYAVLYAWIVATSPSLRDPARLVLFSLLLLAHTVLHWWSLRLVAGAGHSWRGPIAYCLVQGGLVFAISFLGQQPRFVIGLYVALLAEIVALLWPDKRGIALASAFFVGLLALNATLVWGFQGFVRSLPLAGAILAGVLVYALLFVHQIRAHERSKALLQELEAAHRRLQAYASQVEELTLGQERQRMARELHDTLAQGVAGLILQLEAADGHLEAGDLTPARSGVRQAMQHARQTLHEARRAVQALRTSALEEVELVDALAVEIKRFEAVSAVPTTLQVEGDPGPLPLEVGQHLLRIVQESLSNIGRHAQAQYASVRLVSDAHGLSLTIQDDGRGFDLEQAEKHPGHFGLEGMLERAQRMGATLRIESAPQRGTRIHLGLATVREGDPSPGEAAASDRVPPALPTEVRSP